MKFLPPKIGWPCFLVAGFRLGVLWVGTVWGPPVFAAEEKPAPSAALNLADCYRLALTRSESVALSEEERVRAEAIFWQIRSAVWPRIGFRASEKFQEGSGSLGSDRRDRPEVFFYGRQALFHGFRERAALQAQTAEQHVREEETAAARLGLYEDVADVFYTRVLGEARVQTLSCLRRLSEDRLSELKRRVAIGRSRQSEVLSSQTQLARQQAELEEAQAQCAITEEMWRSLLGREAVTLVDDSVEWAEVPPLETFLARRENRPEVRAAVENVVAAEFLEKSVRRGFWPTVDLEGNSYLKRVGPNESVDWDLLLELDFPFYRGGEYRGKTRVASAERRSAQWRLIRARRLAEEDIRTRYLRLGQALRRRDRLSEAARLAQASYNAQQEDYRLGLVTNLDVLSALDVLEETKLDYDLARLQAKWATVKLAVAVDDVPAPVP